MAQDPRDDPASVAISRSHRNEPSEATRYKVNHLTDPKENTQMHTRLIDVLRSSIDWISAQEAFRRCGITDGADTDSIEILYSELKALVKEGRVNVQPVTDDSGRKLHDALKLQDD